ncbi:hypothetical protein FBU30_001654 [Linnemannia zychae]|nr:hypothetical protein FBU30_001654 [Linnemannia zychae]
MTTSTRKAARVEEPVVVILVHPSHSLSRAANFELKRAIARTWAKDAEDFGASVFFVGEHDGDTVMRRPSEFHGRAQFPSIRFMDSSDNEQDTNNGSGGSGSDGTSKNGGTNANDDTGGIGGTESVGGEYFKQEPMRKMLIPSILENGQADSASGLLKAYHFLYNNTNWYAGPMLQTFPFILTTDTTHYIHVENLVTTLLSSRPRRLLTMKDDHSFTGSFSEASECSAEDFGDKVPPIVGSGGGTVGGYQDASKNEASHQHTHWALSGTHLVSRQLVALIGPHLHQCVLSSNSSPASTPLNRDAPVDGEAFQNCIQQWASHPLFWKNGYCGRLAALRYDATMNPQGVRPDQSSSLPNSPYSKMASSTAYDNNKRVGRRGLFPPSTSPEDFEAFYQMKQRERAQFQSRRTSVYNPMDDAIVGKGEDRVIRQEGGDKAEKTLSVLEGESNTLVRTDRTVGTSHWIVGSGLTLPEDFTFLYQTTDRERNEQTNSEENE